MYISNITDDYNDTLTTNITNGYNDTLSSNCTKYDNNIEIIIPLVIIIPCGMSLICLICLMVYTLVKPLINIK